MTTTPREGAQPQHRQCASTGRLSAVMFIGQLGWAAVGAACGTLLAALAAEVKPETRSTYSPYSRPPAPLLLLAA